MSQFFSYRPRSGSRVIAAKVVPGIVIGHPPAGTICAGSYVELTYWTAEPNKHWRTAANRMAREIVEQCGGLAEDDRGCVALCVPPQWAIQANRFMNAVSRDFAGSEPAFYDPNQKALWRAGLLRVQALDPEAWGFYGNEDTPILRLVEQYCNYEIVPCWSKRTIWCATRTWDHPSKLDTARSGYSYPFVTTENDLSATHDKVQFSVCPIALPDLPDDPEKPDLKFTERRAVRVGLSLGDTWPVVFADLHCCGEPFPFECCSEHVHHVDCLVSQNPYSYAEDIAVDANGNTVVQAVSV